MKEIKQVLICGGGMMGKGIAHVLSAREDIKITVYDEKDTDFVTGLAGTFDQLVVKDILTREQVATRINRVGFTMDLYDIGIQEADLVIECVFEKLEIKQEMFRKLEQICREDTIFCTNTSVISPTEIAAKLRYKSRLVGTHFWNPAYLIPLVEVVKSEESDQEVAETVMEFLKQTGKEPVLCKKDVPGFIANRLQHALWREALYLVEQGIADPQTVDEAIRRSFGLRLPQLGPMENMDMVGTDLTLNIHQYIFQYLCNDTSPSPLLQEKVDQGELGFKSGKGFRSWTVEEAAQSKEDLNEYLIKMIYDK